MCLRRWFKIHTVICSELTLNYQVQSFSSWDITYPLVWFWLRVSFRWFLGFYKIADSSAKNPGWSLLMALTHGQGSQWSPVCWEILSWWSSDPDPILWTTGYPLSTSKLNKLKQETFTVFLKHEMPATPPQGHTWHARVTSDTYPFAPRPLWPTGQLLDFLNISQFCCFLSLLAASVLSPFSSILSQNLSGYVPISGFQSPESQYTSHEVTERTSKADRPTP